MSAPVVWPDGTPDVPGGPWFAILGPLEARTAHGDQIQLGPFKQRIVLALLLCRANSVVPVRDLADALWTDSPPRTAPKNLQVYVSTLRRILDAHGLRGRLVHQPPGYRIALQPGELDLLDFEALAREGREAVRAGDPGRAAPPLRAALRLWRGPALADLGSVPALAEEALRLERRRAAVAEDWVEAELDLGRHAELLTEIEALVARFPMRERLRSAHLIALYRCGRQREALAAYEDLRQTLAAELGLPPSPALTRLYHAILDHDPTLTPPDP